MSSDDNSVPIRLSYRIQLGLRVTGMKTSVYIRGGDIRQHSRVISHLPVSEALAHITINIHSITMKWHVVSSLST